MWWSTSTLWQLSCPEPAAPSASASETTTTRWEDGTVCLESGIIHYRPGYKTYSFLGWVQNPPPPTMFTEVFNKQTNIYFESLSFIVSVFFFSLFLSFWNCFPLTSANRFTQILFIYTISNWLVNTGHSSVSDVVFNTFLYTHCYTFNYLFKYYFLNGRSFLDCTSLFS